ncbi:hypothetical protein TNCV_3342411 [Trichonephila clavipes]|nr:hypothetical protein TNCV_3342411 [Trichonephila clavipes]
MFSWVTLRPVVVVEQTMNATGYLKMIADQLHPYMAYVFPAGNGMFQLDNAPPDAQKGTPIQHLTRCTITKPVRGRGNRSSRAIHGCVEIGTMHGSIVFDCGSSNIWCKHSPEGRQTITDLHNNANPNVSGEIQRTLKNPLKSVETPAKHSRFVSLKPSTLFPLKRTLRIHSDDEMRQVFVKNQPRSFYSEGIDLLSKRLNLCYNAHGELF